MKGPAALNENAQPTIAPIDISVVIPLNDEAGNVVPLYKELHEVMGSGRRRYELIFVDDGSRDGTFEAVLAATDGDEHCVVIGLTRNFGQTAALAAGFEIARGEVIVPMDGDLQNDPRDIERLVAALDEPPGYDVVSGWRRDRQDRFLTRRLPSVLANRIISWSTGVKLKDLGCSLKAYRRSVLEDVTLYGEMHRFLPIITRWRGAKIKQIPVNHRPRVHGSTKYDLRRTVKVLLDLVTVKFLGGYLTKPIYFFGKASLLSLAVSIATIVVAVFQRYGRLTSEPIHLNRNVLVLLSAMLMLMAIMFVMLGVIAELLVRIYHESQGRKIYKIRELVHPGDARGRTFPQAGERPSCPPELRDTGTMYEGHARDRKTPAEL